MSLLISILCMSGTMIWYWNQFAVLHQADHWLILRGVGLSLLVGLIAHRAVWILLDKLDSPFNDPAPLYTKMSLSEATSAISSHLKKQGFDSSYGQQEREKGILSGQKSFSLVHTNIFLLFAQHSQNSYEVRGLQTGRLLDNLPGPLGSIFRFFGEATWYTGDFSVHLGVSVKLYGIDDDCTLVKITFRNEATPPVINIWGPLTRFFLFSKIKSLVNATDRPADKQASEVKEPDVPDHYPVDRSGDYVVPPPPKNMQEFKQLWQSAKHGDSIAQLIVGNAYRDGIVVKQDYKKANQCYRYAAERNNADAQYALWQFFRDGIIVEADSQIYKDFCQKAAEGGNPEAMYEVGCWTMKQERAWAAYEWFEKAAKLGHIDSMCYAAYLLLRYAHVIDRTDGRGAAVWYTEAANRGSTVASYSLATLRANDGKIKPAIAQYRKAAIGGHAGAQLEIGYRYLHGDGLEQNLRRAQYWLQKAASQNEPNAEAHLHFAEQQLAECARLSARASAQG